MSSDLILSANKLKNIDSDLNQSALLFGSESFYANNKVITPLEVTVNGTSTGDYSRTDVGNVVEESINLKASNENIVSLKAAASTTSYTLTFPESLGAVNQYIKNDGSGNLSFSELVGGYGYEHSWNFGTTKQLWSANMGDPFGVGTQYQAPTTTISKSGKWAVDNTSAEPFFFAQLQENYAALVLSNASCYKSRTLISWDQSESSTYWDMRVQLKVSNTNSRQAFNNIAVGDYIYFFGNDTLQNVSFTSTGNAPSGGAPADSTGIVVVFKYNNYDASGRNLQVWENGTQTYIRTNIGLDIGKNGGWYDFRIVRRGSNLQFIKSGLDRNAYLNTSPDVVLEHTLTTEPTGTRWGVGYWSGNTTTATGNSCVSINCIECRAL